MRQQNWKDIYIDKGVNTADHKPHEMNKYMRKNVKSSSQDALSLFYNHGIPLFYQEECAGPMNIPPRMRKGQQ